MDIVHTVEIDTTAEALIRTLTTRQGIGGWYTPETKAEPRLGSTVECAFGDYGALKFRLDELDPRGRLRWTVVQGPPEWLGTSVSFAFTDRGGTIDLEFRHAGLPAEYDAFSSFNYLWGQYVRSIRLYAETGVGEPFGSPASRAAGTTPRTQTMRSR